MPTTTTTDKALAAELAPASTETAIKLGLREEEFEQIKKILGRTPNFTETSIYSAMWLSLIHISEPTRPY